MNRAGGRRALEPADVVAPEAEAGQAEREPAAQGLGHRLVARLAVAAPVHRELLAADRGRPGEQHGLAVPACPADLLEHRLVVQERVVVVHQGRVGAVVPHHVDGDPLAEVGLDGVDPGVEQGAHLAREPVARSRVGEVDHAHAGDPLVGCHTEPSGRRSR